MLKEIRYANGATLTASYDLVGNLLNETDPEGNATAYEYDPVGRMTAVTDALGNTTRYDYDAADNLTRVTDALGHVTSYTYDALGNLTSETDALGNTVMYSYTPEGWLETVTDAEGHVTRYSYDKTGNTLSADYAGEQTETNTYNELGLLTTVTTAEGDTLYQYDDASRLISVTQPSGDTVSYTYDSHGNRSSMTYPNGKTVKYTYDEMNRLIAVKGVDGETTKYSYDALGRRIATDGVKEDTVYAYDEVGNLVSQTTTGAYDLALEYAYDLSGRMTSESRTENGATLTSVFAYDPLGQLTSFTRSDGQSETYTYDPVGNMTAKTKNGVSTTMRYNAANQLIQSVTGNDTTKYTYDANGNLVRSENAVGARSYAYNALNLLESFTREDGYTENYSYNANRLLSEIRTSEDLTTTLTWDILYGDGVVISAAQNGQTTNYTYGLERISAISGSTRTEYVYDGRGSVVAEVSYNNAWYTFGGGLARKNVTSKSYTPFGEQIGEATSGFGYNGEYYNAATGMIYLRARFYEPEMNRFGQKDTLRGNIADGISLNRYLYCQSDPVNFADYTTSSSGSTTPRVYTSASQPKVYSNSYQEYQDQRRNAVTPNPQEYAMLRQTGYSGSFSQYASNKTHTQFPSYPEYMQGRAMGNPYYVTYNNGKPTPVAYQRAFYTNNQSNNATSGISRDAPEVYDVTGGQYSCGRDIHALGAGDYGAEYARSGIEKTGKILWEIAKSIFDAVEVKLGVGQGIGLSGLIEGYFDFSLQTSANYLEIRVDNGTVSFGQSYKNEAYLSLPTGKLGFAKNEIADWNGNWETDEQSSFNWGVPLYSIGVDVSAYLIVGASFSAELNLAEILQDLPKLVSRIKEIVNE